MCNYFILSDSTFHWWIAFLKWSKDNSTNVHVFNDTDITNRCLLNSNLRKEWKFFSFRFCFVAALTAGFTKTGKD